MQRTPKKFIDQVKVNRNYKNLVLCGGGSKCMTFCGAIRFLEEYRILSKLKRIFGTSAGAIIGLMICLGYNANEIEVEMDGLNTQKILGTSGGFSYSGLPRIMYNLWYYNGINDGSELFNFLKSLFLKKKVDYQITMKELYNKSQIKLYMVATCISTKPESMEVFSYRSSPNTRAIDAAFASACIPFVIQPKSINNRLYVDGGMKNNFPIRLVPRGQLTLALKVVTDCDDDTDTVSKLSFVGFINCMLNILFSNAWSDEHHVDDYVDIIDIEVPNISFVDFDQSSETKNMLHSIGYNTLNRKMCNLDII